MPIGAKKKGAKPVAQIKTPGISIAGVHKGFHALTISAYAYRFLV